MKLTSKKALALVCIGTITAGVMTINAATLSKTAKLVYNNIKVRVDGEYKAPKLEPFFIGDSVYVSLRDAGELTNNQIGWDSVNQTVDIQTGGSQISVSDIELASKNAEIARLKAEVEKLKEELADQEDDGYEPGHSSGTTQPTKNGNVKETYDYIVKNYSNNYNIDWDFELAEKNNGDLKLEVSYDSYDDGKDFDKMSESAVKNLMKDIIKTVQSKYDDVAIEGSLYDDAKKETVAKFDLSARGSYTYETVKRTKFTKSDLEDFEKKLKDEYKSFPEIDFGSEYDGRSIRMNRIELTETDGTIDFEVHTTFMSRFSYAWNNLDEGSATDKLEDYMDDIQEDIEDKFDVSKVKGYLYNDEGRLMAEYRDGDIKLKTIK